MSSRKTIELYEAHDEKINKTINVKNHQARDAVYAVAIRIYDNFHTASLGSLEKSENCFLSFECFAFKVFLSYDDITSKIARY